MPMPEMTIKDGDGTNRSVNYHLGADASATLVKSGDTNIATYSAGGRILAANMAATLSELIVLKGSATKIVRVKKLHLEAGATTGLNASVLVRKHTVANTGGTPITTPTAVPFDSGDAAATAVPIVYSANPTVDATKVTLAARGLTFTALATAPGVLEMDFVRDVEHALVLRGVAQEIAVDFAGVTPGSGSVLDWHIVWSEESES